MKLRTIRKRIVIFIVNHVLNGTRFFAAKRRLLRSIGYEIGENTKIVGPIHNTGTLRIGANCWIGCNLTVHGNGTVTIGENCVIDRAIIAEDTVIGDNVVIGIGSDVPNKMKPNIYSGGLATIGENSVIPSNVQIGKNTAISGVTAAEDYEDGVLASGETLIKAGERV